ncbi:hypothetical protein TNCV_4149282 [Trichonephila clavipes]|nr:hypothetical protein TNCV_4149282 [Trichonephila clavipes]
MVSDGAKFAVGNIERLFKEARQNTRVKKENGRSNTIEGGAMKTLGPDPFLTTCVPEIELPKKLVLHLQEERCKSKGEPVRSRGELLKRPSPNNQSRYSRQQAKQHGLQQQEQNQKIGRSSHHSPGQSRHSRQQDRQETNGKLHHLKFLLGMSRT